MKKLILSAVITATLFISAFANTDKAGRQLNRDLEAAMKSSKEVQWKHAENFSQASFSFNGKPVFAYFNSSDQSLVGYSFHLASEDIPADFSNAIKAKYAGWNVTEAIMFIDDAGNTNYFATVQNGKKNLVLKSTGKGRLAIFSKLPV